MTREQELERALKALISWTGQGQCAECKMYREAPSAIEWEHAVDCEHLKSINKALQLLGRPPEAGHSIPEDEVEATMRRKAAERRDRCGWYVIQSSDGYLAEVRGDRSKRRWTKYPRFALHYIGERAALHFAAKCGRPDAVPVKIERPK